jgi:hypothetical protein
MLSKLATYNGKYAIYNGLYCIYFTSQPFYIEYSDSSTLLRKGVRNQYFIVDKALTETGFNGTENIDWINIKMMS